MICDMLIYVVQFTPLHHTPIAIASLNQFDHSNSIHSLRLSMDLDGPDGFAAILHSQLQQQNTAESASAEQDDEQNFDFLLNPDVREQQEVSEQSFDFLLQDNSEDEQAMRIIRNRLKEKSKVPETRGRKPGSTAFKEVIARFAASPIDDGSDPTCEPGSIEYARACLQQKNRKEMH